MIIAALLALFLIGSAEAATLAVGPNRQYETIGAALTASTDGDIINVYNGTYAEQLTISHKQITLTAAADNAPSLVGTIRVNAINTTIRGITIRNWVGDGSNGIYAPSTSGLTVENCNIHDGPPASSAIYTRSSSAVLIRSNALYNCSVGINIVSCRSPAGTYEGGTRIIDNDIHDNYFDGVDLHGQYITVQGNYIWNNIAPNWQAMHPDGIQLIDSTVDGQAGVQNVHIAGNKIKNHTQNIFAAYYCSEVHIWNNVVWMDAGTINGVDLDTIPTKNIICLGSANVHIYNNTLGRCNNTSILLGYAASQPPMNAHVTNNIITGVLGNGVGVWFENDRDFGSLDNNLYHNNANDVKWNSTYFTTVAEFASAHPPNEANHVTGDPLFASSTSLSVLPSSPAIGNGAILSSLYSLDFVGVARPSAAAWTIGAFQESPPVSPENLRAEITLPATP